MTSLSANQHWFPRQNIDSAAKMLTCLGEVMSDLHHSMYVQVMTLLMYGLV